MLHRPLLSVLLASAAWLGAPSLAMAADKAAPKAAPAATPAAAPACAAAAPSPLLQSLEAALNAPGDGPLEALLQAGPGFNPSELIARRLALRSRFADAQWRITPGPTLADGRTTALIQVRGSRQQDPFAFMLEADQQVLLAWRGGRLVGQEILREQSLLRSAGNSLAVQVQIPDAVLTGQRYDVDLILEQPLDGAITAGGLIALTPRQVRSFEMPVVPVGPLFGGGLFKTVQAPPQPGAQTWAMVLVHPQGIVSLSKRVRVVSDRAQLRP